MIRLVLADDHTVLRQGLRSLLDPEVDLTVIGEAGDGREALERVAQLRPDVLVLDLLMPELGGLEVVRQVRAHHPATRVVVLSMYANEAYVQEALAAGASGYVLKKATQTELVHAIRTVAAGGRYLSAPLTPEAIEAYVARSQASLDPYEMLTEREREVFHLAAEGHSSAAIARRLALSSRTVEMHRGNLMRKLDLHNQTELVRFALQRGILSLDS